MLLLPLAALAADQAANNATVIMDEVVVSATRTEKKVDDAPSSVTVITREEMRKQNVTTIDDALRHEAGLYAKRNKGIADSIASVSMRGQGGDERNLFLLNGIPVNDGYSNNVPWNHLNIDDVERIEIIRGPGSALYGGHAMGGVVNIITKEPEKEFEGMARYGVGFLENENDVNLHTWGLMAGSRIDPLKVRVSLDAADSQGYPTDLVTKSTSAGAAQAAANSGYAMQSSTGAANWVMGDKGDNHTYRENVDAMLRYDLPEDGWLRLDVLHGHNQYWYTGAESYLFDGSMRGRASAYPGTRSSAIAPRDFIAGRGKEELIRDVLTYGDKFAGTDFTGKFGYQRKDKWYTSPCSSTQKDWRGLYVDNSFDSQPGYLVESVNESFFVDLQDTVQIGRASCRERV